VALKRNFVTAANSGSITVNSIKAACRKMDYQVGVRNVGRKVPDTYEKVIESIFGMKTGIALSKGSSKSYAPSAASGRLRVSFSETVAVETGWHDGAGNVYIRLPASRSIQRGKVGEEISDTKKDIG
jgi:hypothetical protein